MTAEPAYAIDVALAMIRSGLDDALAQIRGQLIALADREPPRPFAPPKDSAFPVLGRIFRLTGAEIHILALATGGEIDPATLDAARAASGASVIEVRLAERLAGPAIWDALVPEAPLRRWRMIELRGAGPLHTREIRLDERVLHALLGAHYLDARLEGLAHHVPAGAGLAPRESMLCERISAAWSGARKPPVVLIGGPDRRAKRAIAAKAAQAVGLRLYRVHAPDLPADWSQRAAIATFLDRELALSRAAALIEGEGAEAIAMADLLAGPTLVSVPDPDLPEREPVLRLNLEEARRPERRALWRTVLGPKADALGPDLDRLAAQFALSPGAMRAAAAELDPATPPERLGPALWRAARAQGRRALDGLADRIESRATWEDLVLPDEHRRMLDDLAGHMRDSWRVTEDWGWGAKSPRGLGAAALFAGASGTGKTLAAEALAGELDLDLYRIDLSQVVSKYIGETEKNLARIFSAAEDGGAILLFDEADALFGKRSEVKDSHDRYANVEVSYLLQRMEAYSGLAILTTNQKGALDAAFLRRLRYVLSFPFPDPTARARIWARIFPPQTPTEGLDARALAQLNIAGGAIRSIALNAAYLAAGESAPVRMSHVLRAARREYAKLEKPFTNAEMGAFR